MKWVSLVFLCFKLAEKYFTYSADMVTGTPEAACLSQGHTEKGLGTKNWESELWSQRNLVLNPSSTIYWHVTFPKSGPFPAPSAGPGIISSIQQVPSSLAGTLFLSLPLQDQCASAILYPCHSPICCLSPICGSWTLLDQFSRVRRWR